MEKHCSVISPRVEVRGNSMGLQVGTVNIPVTEIYQKKEIIIETVEYERKLDSDTI
jgi:hypothetical protein